MTASAWLAELRRGMLDLVFAPVCTACGEPIAAGAESRLVCAPCWARMRTIPAPRCSRCWLPRAAGASAEAACSGCAELPPALRAVRSAYLLSGPARNLAHALKYRGWYAVAELMADRMAMLSLPEDVLEEADVVVPVPTSRSRLRERGYNQAEMLARALAERTGRRCEPERLSRVHAAGTQTALHPSERRANVAGAFTAVAADAGPTSIGDHVLLVDDVWTTGATAVACAQALLASGTRAVSVITFARALPELDREARL
jgi:ComF family protein